MRSALRRGGLSAAVFGLAVLGQVAFAETVTLSLDQARHAAGQALLAGDPALAVALARRLLEAEPKDAYALLILAAGEQQMGDPASGRRDGRTAWAAAKGLPGLRYEIARHTALATLQLGAPIAAAFWLRRAVETAPDAAARSQSLQDLTTLRARSRLNYAFNLAMTPSANLNGGASGGFLIIDDSLIVGPLSGSAQALSGLRLAETLTASYGISASDQAVTRVGVQLFATQNSFSAAAKAQAPDLQAADLNQTTVEVNLAKDYLFTQDQPVPLSATLALGRSAVGGNDSGPYLRFGLNGPLAAGSDWVLSGRFGAERHWRTLDRIDATSFGLQQSRKLPGGSSIGWSVTTAPSRRTIP